MKTKAGTGRTALITGASAGIGAALSRVFAENGFDVVLTARRGDRLAELASELRAQFGVKATAIAADLADPKTPRRLFEEVRAQGVVVDALAKDGVQVTALCPGFTYTEFHDVSGMRALVSRLPSFVWMDAETVAREGYRAVMAGQPICIPGGVNRAIASATRLIPESMALKAMKRQPKRLHPRE
jgi:short-subunit dehydrogenase